MRNLALIAAACTILYVIGMTFAAYPADARPVDPFTTLLTGIGQAFNGQPTRTARTKPYRGARNKGGAKQQPVRNAYKVTRPTAVPSYRPVKQHDVARIPAITVHPVAKPRDGQLLPGSANRFDPPMADLYIYPVKTLPGGSQRGVASWYGPGFHGRQTACGNLYNEWGMTAAHRTLKCGTVVEVHASNGKMVTVTIRDRGPYISGRIIDLSRGAAQQLGMLKAGTARVTLFVLGG